MRLRHVAVAVFAVACAVALLSPAKVSRLAAMISRRVHRQSAGDRLRAYEPDVRARLATDLARAGLSWPLRHVWMVAYKSERRLDVYGADAAGAPRFVHAYGVLGASGVVGPKLREGDRQVPEGMYRVDALNPNSLYHLALHVDYPNDDDRAMAARDGRAALGGDIMIHGGAGSVGCLAMGDQAAEDLFVLAARAGVGHVDIWIAPVDLRVHPAPTIAPAWAGARYAALRAALETLPAR